MNGRADVDELWPRLAPLLIPYAGMASQIYVLDLPVSAASACIDAFESTVKNLSVKALDGFTFGNEEQKPLDKDARQKVISNLNNERFHILHGFLCEDRDVSFWILTNNDNLTFDAELVFWADQFFPDGNSPAENAASLAPLLDLAETFRKEHLGCECVLTTRGSQDPRNQRHEPWAKFW